jgi:hypothetical protein
MRFGSWLLVGFAVGAAGCGAQASSEPGPEQAAKTSAESSPLYAQLRAGAFNLDAAATSLQTALESARKLLKQADGDPKQALLDLVALVDDAGEAISDDTIAPSTEEVAKDPKGHETDRLDAIEHASDALKSVAEASAISGDLAQSAPEELRPDAEVLDKSIVEAMDALKDAVRELGQKAK